ncbi:hypothetical protein [Bizionia echini]|uniref:hypothetical protein n=1 Tax=Bizionia echini TaxID=649333 RepID=UPI0030D8B7A0|tara:strand:+ start:212 stop:697 length:486 start_codon:yes stop_codon:yes gene_type:complete
MKNLITVIITSFLLFTACEGPQGPPGRDGGLIVSPAFEIELDFTAGNNYEYFEPYGFNTYPADVTLVYILWEIVDGQEVWRLLPQTVQFEDGSLMYNFDFTRTDVRFFLDGTVNFNTLDSSWTRNQVFRVVVVPADNVGKQDFSDINVVMESYGITNFEKR